MRGFSVGLIMVVFLFVIFITVKFGFFRNTSYHSVQQQTRSATITKKLKGSVMKITSPAFADHQEIPVRYTCKGVNSNPPLQFSGIPTQAKSLALIMDDPDAPVGTWVHWTVFNIDPETKGIEENSKPASGVEAMTSFGKPGYGGPCPPSGTHRYFFKLYALDTRLELTGKADKKAIEEKMQGHTLDQTELMGLFSK